MTTHQKSESASVPLRFDDYLRMLPSSWVFEHFLKKNSGGRRILSSSAVQDRSRQFARAEALLKQFAGLTPELRLQCGLAYLMGGSGCAAPHGHAGLSDPLVRSFLVYAAKNDEGKTRYFGFNEFEPLLRNAIAETVAAAGRSKVKPRLASIHEGCCLNDIAIVAALAAQGALVKKRQGGLVRNALVKIGKLTHGGAERENERLADLLVSYCLQAGLLRENEERYHCVPAAVEQWFAAPAARQRADLVAFACSFAGSWRLELLREALGNSDGTWLSLSVFPENDRTAAAGTLRILHWAGLVESGRAGAETLFRAAAGRPADDPRQTAGMNGPGVVVLPDFSAIISPDAHPERLYRFAKLGVFQSLDRVYKGALDRDMLNDSLAHGLDGETAIGWLTEWRAPPNVLATVREWVREFNRLYISDSPLMVAVDEKVAYQVGAYGPLRELLSPLPAHAVFRIKRGCVDKAKEIIAGMGFDSRMPDPERNRLDEHPAPEKVPGGDAWEPVVKAENDAEANNLKLRSKKYGAGLKALDLNETMHIIDYATLTGARIEFEYTGSPLLKKGVYTVTPLSCTRGSEPMLEAAGEGGRKKHFYVRKISAIGVGAS
jgi:hypothetical protein